MLDVRLTHQLQRGRRQKYIAHAVIRHQLHRRLRLELPGAIAKHRHAVIPGREQRIEQSADPGPVRRRPHQVIRLRKEVVRHLDIRQMAEQHPMGMQRALGIPGRARGVDDDGGIVRASLDRRKILRGILDGLPERFRTGMVAPLVT